MSEELKALSDIEISRACHFIVTGGEGCWHEIGKEKWQPPQMKGWLFECKLCKEVVNGAIDFHFNPLNNAQDYLTLLFFCVNEWEGWE